MTSSARASWIVAAAALAVLVSTACSTDQQSLSERERDRYLINADSACEKGRARLRSDPAESNSTDVLADMEHDLRALGDPPHALAVIGPDVPSALARVTWAAESFVVAGRYDVECTIVTVRELRALGFRVCGTR